MRSWFKNNLGFVVIAVFVLALIVLYWLVVYCRFGYGSSFMGFDDTDKMNFVGIFLYAGTLLVFWEAYRFRKDTIQEAEKPIPCLFLRKVSRKESEAMDELEAQCLISVNRLLEEIKEMVPANPSYSVFNDSDVDYFILPRIRNMGKGVAFCVQLEFPDARHIQVVRYNTNIYAPGEDEHSIQLCYQESIGEKGRTGQKKLTPYALKNQTVKITCESVAGTKYEYYFQIGTAPLSLAVNYAGTKKTGR